MLLRSKVPFAAIGKENLTTCLSAARGRDHYNVVAQTKRPSGVWDARDLEAAASSARLDHPNVLNIGGVCIGQFAQAGFLMSCTDVYFICKAAQQMQARGSC